MEENDNEIVASQPHDLMTIASHLVNMDSIDPQELFNSICKVPVPDISTKAYSQIPQINVNSHPLNRHSNTQTTSRCSPTFIGDAIYASMTTF